MEQTYFTKYISILYRQGNRFYDRELAKYNIGYGQQFYLPRIYENQGISMYELARLGHFDKGTVTKAVKSWRSRGICALKRMSGISAFAACIPPKRQSR